MTPEEFKDYRKQLGYTQQQMAESLGISRRVVNYMESGVGPIRTMVVLAVKQLVAEAPPPVTEEPLEKQVFLDGKKVDPLTLPQSPLFIVWGPEGDTPIRYVFSRLEWAQKAAQGMAERYADSAQMFYVAALIYGYQQQVKMAEFPLRLRII